MNETAFTFGGTMPTLAANTSFHGNSSDLPWCPELRDEDENEAYKQFYKSAQLVTGMFIYPIICFPGLLCNGLSVYVMTRRNMLTSTNAFLSALAVADSIKLLNDILYFLVIVFMHMSPTLGNLSYGYLYPYSHFVFNMAVCVSAWLTVSVAVERYILVCHPTKARAVWSRRRAVTLCAVIYTAMTCLALPSALRYRTIRCVERASMSWRLEVELTEMWRNKTFVVIYSWIQNLMRSIIPLIVLIILNACIVWALRKTRTKRRKSPRHRVTVMMIVVILTFLICITPDAILSTVFGFGYHEAGYLVKGVREITDTLLGVNAGVNFLIYCAFNKVFRRRCARLCCSRVPQTGWFTEMDESTYRRLSEAKSALFSNNNSPPRPGKKSGYHPDKGLSPTAKVNSPTMKSPHTRREVQRVEAQGGQNKESGMDSYPAPKANGDSYRYVTTCYSDGEDSESKALIQQQQQQQQQHALSRSPNTGSHSGCVTEKVLCMPGSHVLGQLISASLSLPSLPQGPQDTSNCISVYLSSKPTNSHPSGNILEHQRKSLSQPLLPLQKGKYEIPVCSCFYTVHAPNNINSPFHQKQSDVFHNKNGQPVPGNIRSLSLPSESQCKDQIQWTTTTTTKVYSKARHRPSSNGLKKSRNSVKSKRAKRKECQTRAICSDGDLQSESSGASRTAEHQDSSTRKDSCFSSSPVTKTPGTNFPNLFLEGDKKSKLLMFVPPCIEGVRSKNVNIYNPNDGCVDKNGRSAGDNIAVLKNVEGFSLNNKTINTGGGCSKTILTVNKTKSCTGSSYFSSQPKHGRGTVVRFQDTVT